MKSNVGKIDRTVRLIAGLLLLSAGVAAGLTGVVPLWAAITAGALGLILVLTGLIRICPLYLPFGFKSR